jgi:tricorn protease
VYRSESGAGEASGHNLVVYDFASGKETMLTQSGNEDANPQWSPDGKSIACLRNDRELHVATVPAKDAAAADRVVASGALPESTVTWSPDGQWIAYTLLDKRSFRNVMWCWRRAVSRTR